jgi:hypothetical protein
MQYCLSGPRRRFDNFLMPEIMEYKNVEIDPVQYGVLWHRVHSMSKKMDKMEQQLEELVTLANKSKGGLWFGMTMVSFVSAFVGFVMNLKFG